jgi:hypothetical protein
MIRARSGESIDVIDSWSLTSLLLAIRSLDPDVLDEYNVGAVAITVELGRPEVEQLMEEMAAWLARGEV